MKGFDYSFILNQTAVVSANLTRQVDQRGEFEKVEDRLRERLATVVTPALVAFLGHLSAAAPGEEDRLRPVLSAFFADPATAEGLVRLSGGDNDARDDLGQLFLAAGDGDVPVSRYEFEDALTEFTAVMQAVMSELTVSSDLPLWVTDFFSLLSPDYLSETGDHRDQDARGFIEALGDGDIGGVSEGRVLAPDGLTLIYAWHPAGWASASPDEPPRMEPGEPVTANGGGAAGSLPPPTEPEQPADKPPAVVALRLDAALPEQVVVGRVFDLAVSIRQPASPVLAPADLTRHESADFAAIWPADKLFISLRVQVAATGCDIVGSDTTPVRLIAGQDSPPVYFRLRPQHAGSVSVIITIYQEADWIGSTRVVTDAAGEAPRGQLQIHVDSQVIGDPEVNLNTLRRILDDAYNSNELRDLCFEVGIDFEDIPGDTQSAKARELVLFARRRGLEARLVELVIRDRPHLFVPA
jgi:hypothetical protein